MQRVGLFLLAMLMFAPATAQDDDKQAEQASKLDTITVVAHRQPRKLSEVAGTVTVIGEDRLVRDMAMEPSDLVRYEPGVELDGGGTRFGFSGFRIRGIGGNRTSVIVDGVPVGDQFEIGSFADTGRGLLELGLARRVEILRGPASTLYGSKALGGVVAITTLDTPDLIIAGDSEQRIGLTGASDSDRLRLNAVRADRGERADLLIAAAGQRGAEIGVADRPTDTPRDRLDREHAAVLIRGGLDTGRGRLRLTLDGMRETRDSDVRAMLGRGRLRFTEQLTGDDRRHQWRIVLDQQLEPIGPISRGQWRLWRQTSDVLQESREQRPNAPTPVDVYRRFEFSQDMTGLGADLESEWIVFGRSHRLGYGFEYTRSEVLEKRDGLETNRVTGQSTRIIIGEVFPLRDFPRSRVSELGVYLHDEIELWRGGPTLSPGIRYEHYDLSVLDDPLFEASFPNAVTTELSTAHWLPKLGLVWPIGQTMEWFAQYARGVRAPPFGDVNIGLELAQFGVRAIANPDLESERGTTIETGLRWRGVNAQAELALFRNDYKDFIQTRAPLGFDPVSGFIVFQSINRDRVRIEGGELRWRRHLDAGFSAELAGEWSRGEDRGSGRNLPGVSPPALLAELAWMSPSASLESRIITTAVRGQRELVDEQGEPLFSPPGYLTVDWLTRWFPREDLEVSFGLFNLTDRSYWRTGPVIGRAADDPTLALLAEPGRWAMLSLTWRSF